MPTSPTRKQKARSKGHIGFSGDGDQAALQGRRARTLAARTARAKQRASQVATAIATAIDNPTIPASTINELVSKLDAQDRQIRQLQNDLQALQKSVQHLTTQSTQARQAGRHSANQQYPPSLETRRPPYTHGTMAAHHAARIKGLTRQLLLRAPGGMSAQAVANLIRDGEQEPGGLGVTWSAPRAGRCILTCRDELHRQQVLRSIKKLLRRAQSSWRASCWLSTLQRKNKDQVYAIIQGTTEHVKAVDWGDRVAIFKGPPAGPTTRSQRYVVDLAQSPKAIIGQLRAQWSKWQLSPFTDPTHPTVHPAPSQVPATIPTQTHLPPPPGLSVEHTQATIAISEAQDGATLRTPHHQQTNIQEPDMMGATQMICTPQQSAVESRDAQCPTQLAEPTDTLMVATDPQPPA